MTRIAILLVALLPAAAAFADATPAKLSSLGRSIFFRGGRATRGNAGTNGGHYTDRLFDGNFENYTYCNNSGVTELVIPTTGLDETGHDTGVAWYVTSIKVGHNGTSRYSLYYTTEPEPADILSQAKDPRTWTAIDNATDKQVSGTQTYAVNQTATAVKYVFDTFVSWGVSLAEVEAWGIDPAEMGCRHPSFTDWEAVSGSASCTDYGIERCKCTACGEVFERTATPPLGHDWETRLVAPGSSSTCGSGSLVCSRCGESIVFNVPLDLATLGGVAAEGKVQFTDLAVSASHPDGGGAGPDDLIDGDWTYEWGAYWFPATRDESEYVQYEFGTEIDLTKIEWSAANHAQTLKFYLWDGETETPLAEVAVADDDSGLGYQRGSLSFRGVSAKGLRLHIADSIGVQYGGGRFVSLSELHPHGTVKGAGMLDVVRTRILLY